MLELTICAEPIPSLGRIFISQTSLIIAGIVQTMILKSSHNDISRTYSKSRFIICSKVVLFLPLTCHNPVNPGGAWQRRLWRSENKSYSYGVQGRGPTRLMSPRRTLNNWGNSSKPLALNHIPPAIRRLSPAQSNFRVGWFAVINCFKCA